ncbi:MAG: DUF1175 family protein [Bryobacterales bacterium]|nr:DUF1175 family protein [Bryobacterales bacterium]
MSRKNRYGILFGIVALAGLAAGWLMLVGGSGRATVGSGQVLQADGISRLEIELHGGSRARATEDYLLKGAPGVARVVQIRRERERDVAIVQAGVVPGETRLLARGPSGDRAMAEVDVTPDWQDRNANGFPDSLELGSPGDARAFRDWFRFLAEEQYYRGDDLHPEVNDCAALLRYAYREALRRHDGEWAVRIGLKAVKPIPDLTRYHYPYTPLGADLFRLRAGAFQFHDLRTNAFGQFADAETLLLYNASAIGKDIEHARPGDLLFYRQENQSMPFHAMLYLGESTIDQGGRTEYVLYHTGPDGSWKGEMRRPSVAELFRHPEPRWHPTAANPAFLGVYRWKILGQPSVN